MLLRVCRLRSHTYVTSCIEVVVLLPWVADTSEVAEPQGPAEASAQEEGHRVVTWRRAKAAKAEERHREAGRQLRAVEVYVLCI